MTDKDYFRKIWHIYNYMFEDKKKYIFFKNIIHVLSFCLHKKRNFFLQYLSENRRKGIHVYGVNGFYKKKNPLKVHFLFPSNFLKVYYGR